MNEGRTLKTRILGVAFVAMGLLTFGPASAQTPKDTSTGSRLAKPIDDYTMKRREQEKLIADTARCAYEWAPVGVEKFLENSDEFAVDNAATGVKPKNLWPAYHIKTCLERAMDGREDDNIYAYIGEREFRAMMLEPSYLKHHATPPDWSMNWPGTPRRKYVSTGEALGYARLSGEFADCVVAGAPRLADNLLRTVKYSPEEGKAIRGLVPFIGPCIVEGQKAELTPVGIRKMVADGMWTASRAFARNDLVTATAGGGK